MSINRLTLPSAFQDKLSEKILMPPEPTYFWANLLFLAEMEAELKAAGGSLATAGRTFSGSGIKMSDQLSTVDANAGRDVARADAFSIEKFAVGAGSTVKMNRTVFSDTTYTEASRLITRATLGTAGVDLTGEQVELTIQRYGGPYTGSAVGPHIIESFDLERASEDLVDKVAKHLRRDRNKFVDTVVAARAIGAPVSTTSYVYPGDPNMALTTDNAAFLSQGDRPLDLESLIRGEEIVLTLKIPTFSNGRYAAAITPKQARQVKTNSRFQDLASNFKEKNPLFENYIGTLGMVDYFVSQTNPTATANSTITVQRGVIFGPGLLAYGIGKACHVEPGDDTNFGQRVSVMWQADEGYNVLDNRLAVSLRSD